MSYYLKQEFEFVRRTLAIIDQYNQLKFEGTGVKKAKDVNKQYEVTLLLNTLVGLLILPQQTWFDRLPEDVISRKEWGIDSGLIAIIKGRNNKTKNYADQAKSVKNVVTHLRNSVSHYHFTVFDNSHKNLSKIKFEDFTDESKTIKTFEATFPIPAFRQFVTKFANHMLDVMNASK